MHPMQTDTVPTLPGNYLIALHLGTFSFTYASAMSMASDKEHHWPDLLSRTIFLANKFGGM